MQIDLNKFLTEEKIEFDESVTFNKEELKNVGILDIPKCKVNGNIIKLGDDLYEINMKINGTMLLECSRSLEEIDYDFSININKTFSSEENLKIISNILDIFPIIWENIVLEKPSRIVKENNKGLTKGNGWSLTDEIKSESGLSELDKLLKMEEEK